MHQQQEISMSDDKSIDRWRFPVEVAAIDFAMPDLVFGYYLPRTSEIPDGFLDGWKHSVYCECIVTMFHRGGSFRGVAWKDGVIPEMAATQISTIIRSMEPSRDEKFAGAAYLLSRWMESEDEAKSLLRRLNN